MPRMKNGKRDYSYDTQYESSREQKKHRVERNKARRELTKEGVVRKGDGKDVDHIKALSRGGSEKRTNLQVISMHKNRSKKNK